MSLPDSNESVSNLRVVGTSNGKDETQRDKRDEVFKFHSVKRQFRTNIFQPFARKLVGTELCSAMTPLIERRFHKRSLHLERTVFHVAKGMWSELKGDAGTALARI
jgi:uncharacterized membrane protein YukC